MAAVKKKQTKSPSKTARKTAVTRGVSHKGSTAPRKAPVLRDPAYDKVDQRMINFIPVCLTAALNDDRIARECVKRFEGLTDDPSKIGAEMAKLFVERWGLNRAQVREIRQWPGHQLIAIKRTVIDAGRSRIAGKPVIARVSGKIGVPRSTSITWAEPDFLDIEIIGPDAP